MRETLESVTGDYELYKARRDEFDLGHRIPFRVSPRPLELTKAQAHEVQILGGEVTQYVKAVDELYHEDGELRAMLDTGKPEILLGDTMPEYLFVRPDIIITPNGFTICEIETSPFGLALSEILNRGYIQEGFETVVGENVLGDYIRSAAPADGTIVYTSKTASYQGQMSFLADNIFSNGKKSWKAEHAAEIEDTDSGNFYRGFYQSEYLTDPSIQNLIDTVLQNPRVNIFPSLTPHLEEKAILAVLWDRRWEHFLQSQLGNAAFNHLREVVPPTWVVGQEQYFAPGLPNGITNSLDLAGLSRSRRALVIKPSGFSTNASWSEGVHFLHEKSADKARELLQHATDETNSLHIIQEFRKGKNIPMEYMHTDEELIPMAARVRLTPYYAFKGPQEGTLVSIKATACENTDYIHASTSSINTAVSVK